MNQSTQCLVVIYIGYWSPTDSLQWDVESILELDFKEASTLMGLSDPRSKIIYLVSTDYEGWIGSRFTFIHKGILVITQGCKV